MLTALSSVGFDCHRDSRGHWQCHHSGAGVSLTVCPPHGGRNDVLPTYCRAAQLAVRAVLDWSSDAESDDADP